MKKFLILAGTGAVIYFLLTRRSKPRSENDDTTISDVFKGMVEEMKKPLSEVGKDIPQTN